MKQKIVHRGMVFTLKSKTLDGVTEYICCKCALHDGPLCRIATCGPNKYFKIINVKDVAV